MKAKLLKSPTQIDFEDENGAPKEDIYELMRKSQHHLYSLNSPYQGSKRSIIVDIAHELEKHGIKYKSVFDVFSGSGAVSVFMKVIGKTVISNDILTSSYHNTLAFVENNSINLSQDEIDFLCKHDSPNKNDFVRSRYAGERFTPEEALFLDNYRANIDELVRNLPVKKVETESGPVDDVIDTCRNANIKEALSYVLITHYVIDHCFLGGRLNKGQILARLDHRIAHNRNKHETMSFNLKPLPSCFIEGSADNVALNMDALDALATVRPQIVDLCYLDPPYGGQQSDYAQMFSFCEEYVYGKPLDQIWHLKNAKRFVDSKGYEENFRALLEKASAINTLAISYNDSSWASVDKIKGIVTDYKKNVVVVNISHEYKYRERDNGGSKGTEYLLIAN